MIAPPRRRPSRSPSSSRIARTRSGSPRRSPSSSEEDPSLAYVQDQESGELKLFGQGEMHLRVIVERLAARFGVVGRDEEALGRLSRDHSRRGDGARPPQEAVGRPRPVRRRAGRGRAARPRRRLRLRRARARRHGAAAVFFVGRGGRARRADARAARLSGGRRRGDPDRRLLSHRRFLRHGVSRGGENRARRGVAQGAPGAARADPRGVDLRALRRAGARQRARQRAARPDPRLRGARGLARLGSRCAR